MIGDGIKKKGGVVVNGIINDFKKSEKYKWFKYGDDYFVGENTEIMKRKKQYFEPSMNRLMAHPYKANHKLPAGYFQILVMQKVQTLLENGVTIDGGDELYDIHVNFDDFINDVATTASKKGVAWAYFYIDNGKLKIKEVEPEQIIPFYKNGELETIIRTYSDNEYTYAEVWGNETLEIWRKSDGEFSLQYSGKHMAKVVIDPAGDVIEERQFSLGKIPFVALRNNKEENSDLKNIKPFIDIYDVINSDFANNIDDMQDAFFIIKNYGGENMQEFLMQLKELKAVPVGEDGDVTSHQLHIPVEARQTFLQITDENIYKYAMGVDTNALAGGSLTNVVIKSRYANLMMKVSSFKRQVIKFLDGVTEYYNLYASAFSKSNIKPEFDFTISMIFNESEILEANAKQLGAISEHTRLTNHPWVYDAEKEMAMMSQPLEENPVPLPRAGESEDEYIMRGVQFLLSEGYDEREAVEILSKKWNDVI